MDHQPAPTPSLNLAPAVILTGPPGLGLTPFNLVPAAAAWHAEALLRLGAVPFPMLRFTGADGSTTAALDLWVDDGETPPVFAAPLAGRPLVYWADADHDPARLRQLAEAGPLSILLLGRDAARLDDLAAGLGLEPAERVHTLALDGGDGHLRPTAAGEIWRAFVGQLDGLLLALTDEPATLFAELDAQFTADTDRLIPDDTVTAPNEILAAYGAGLLPAVSDEPVAAQDRSTRAVEAGKEILARRFLATIGLLLADDRTDRAALWANLETVAGRGGFGDEIERLHRLGATARPSPVARHELPLDDLARLAPGQVVLVCPATARDLAASVAAGEIAFGGAVGAAIEREPAFFAEVVRILSGTTGSVLTSPVANDDQELILSELARAVRGETRYHSALALFYASRFGCPILKLDRVPVDHTAPFVAVDAAEATGPDAVLPRIRSLSAELTARIDPVYRRWLGDLAAADEPDRQRQSGRASLSIHAISDYPLELARLGRDYLGFQTYLSRTPLTPADIAMTNYGVTEATTELPTSTDQFVFTSHLPGLDVGDIVLNHGYLEGVASEPVDYKGELLDRLTDPEVRSLVFLGHGAADLDEDRSALLLKDGRLNDHEIEQLDRVPPLVVLVACNSAAATSVRGGLARSFLRAGATAVIGSTFAVPVWAGLLFANQLIGNLLSPGSVTDDGERWYTDLSEVVGVARHRIRPMCTFVDLERRGVIDQATAEAAADDWQARMAALSSTDSAADASWTRVLAETLTRFGVIDDETSPPIDWPTIPYPAYFTLLGYPWTTRTRNWL
ncbi:MAG: CHAT domain-containing protein [Actinomycetota bacterium]